MIEPIRFLRTVTGILGAFANKCRTLQTTRLASSRRFKAAPGVEDLEERVVPAIVAGLGDLQYIAAPGEVNDVHAVLSRGVEASVGVEMFFKESGSSAEAGASIVAGASAQQAGNVAAGNALDGESNAREPQETRNLPSGDGIPGGDFVARVTVDSHPEIGSAGQGGLTIDINGNSHRDGASPSISTAECFIIQSAAAQAAPGTAAALNHQFSPKPLGNDLYAQFGSRLAVPIVGNFDPPVAPAPVPGDDTPGDGTPGNDLADDDFDEETHPTVTLTAIDVPASGIGGTFQLSRTGNALFTVTVALKTRGSAKYGRDYVLVNNGALMNPKAIEIHTAEASIELVVRSLATGKRNTTKSISLKLQPSKNYEIADAKAAKKSAARIAKGC